MKFWNEHTDFVRSLAVDEMVVAYAMLTTVYRNRVELRSTDHTIIEVIICYVLVS